MLQKMAHFCAFQERARFDVRQKLKKLPVSSTDQEYILERLEAEGFIDENRYAAAFVNDKFRLNKWGPQKIAHALKLKQVDPGAIEDALQQISQEELETVAASLAAKKIDSLDAGLPPLEKNLKAARFLLQRGFEPAIVRRVIDSAI